MTIQFINRGTHGCQVRVIYDTHVEAIHSFKHLVEISGKQAFSAVFYPGEKFSLRLIPFFGGTGLVLSDLGFDSTELQNFLSSAPCKHSFNLHYGIEQDKAFKQVEFGHYSYWPVNGYTVE